MRLPGARRAASCRASRSGSSTTTARCCPNDGESVGEFEVRGPWITASYYKDDDPDKFHDGWLRTGDVGQPRRTRASCRSPTGPRTSSSRAASGSPRSSSRTRSWRTRASSRRPSSRCPTSAGTSARSSAWSPARRRRAPTPEELAGFLERQGGAVVAARAVGVHRRGAEDLGRQVRQEGAAGPATPRASSRSSHDRGARGALTVDQRARPTTWPTWPISCRRSPSAWPTSPSTACARRPIPTSPTRPRPRRWSGASPGAAGRRAGRRHPRRAASASTTPSAGALGSAGALVQRVDEGRAAAP